MTSPDLGPNPPVGMSRWPVAYYRVDPIRAVRKKSLVHGRPVNTLPAWMPWYLDRMSTVARAREGDLVAQAVCDALGWSKKWKADTPECQEWHVTLMGAWKCARKYGVEIVDYLGRKV